MNYQHARPIAPTHALIAQLLLRHGLTSHPIGVGAERAVEGRLQLTHVSAANEPKIGLVGV